MRGCLLAFFLLLMASATAHASQPIASIHYPPSDCSGGTGVLNAEGWAELSVEAGTYPKMLSEHALTSADNGSELPMVGEMPGSFAEMVPALTNGVNDNLAYGFFENTQSLDENSLFASVPERSGPDLQGYRIDGMTVQVIDVTTNLNGSGTLLLFSCDLNFVIHGAHLRSLGGTVSGLAGSGLQLGVSLNGGAISAFDTLVDPQSGRIELGGSDIRGLELNQLRDQFSVVSQEPSLFDETIRENILLGRRDISPEALSRALDAAHVTEFTATLPNGLDTPAGPRGSSLSGGQRQRVAIARAVLRDAPILLLDEATSALDATSERLVQEALDRLSYGRTTLVIAHRLATVRGADKIIVLDHGRVVEEGTHDMLLALGGLYAGLCRLQFSE